MVVMRLLTMEAMFWRGADGVDCPLLWGPLETMEKTTEVFLLGISFGSLPSSSPGTCTERRGGASSPSLSDLESSLNKAGSRLTLWMSPRLRGLRCVSGDDNNSSARRRSGIRTVAVLLGDTIEGS